MNPLIYFVLNIDNAVKVGKLNNNSHKIRKIIILLHLI